MRSYFLIPALLITLSGCANLSKPDALGTAPSSSKKETLALMDDAPIPDFSFEQVLSEYRAIVPLVEDVDLAEQIERRIAGVLMMRAEYRHEIAAPVPDSGYYGDVIAAYRQLIEKYPLAKDSGEALYQLAKAYDLEARDTDALNTLSELVEKHPHSPWYSESLFRMGNIHFSRNRYRQAETYFNQLISRQDPRWQTNAYYMNGWALFKQLLYPEALNSFSNVLSRHVPETGELEALSVVEKRLVVDTLSIMSLTMSNDEGIKSLQTLYPAPAPGYVWLVYEALGDLYLEKERFDDAAQTYRAFIAEHPTHDKAPHMHLAMIDGYKTGGFNRYVLDEKENFVAQYGLSSQFWSVRTAEQQTIVHDPLKTFLDELSRYYHAGSRQLNDEIKKANKKDQAALQLEQQKTYAKAAQYYQSYADTFPSDPEAPRMIYMAGETYYESAQFEKAIVAYEQAAYEWPNAETAAEVRAEAGYSAILAYNQVIDRHSKADADAQSLNQWREQTVSAMLKFAQTFANDTRASAVLSQAAEQLFALSDYQRALDVASDITQQQQADPELLLTAHSVAGLSQFELGMFEPAEVSFAAQLALMPAKDPDYSKIQDRLAAAIFRQGELHLVADEKNEAIQDFLRIKDAAPNSAIRQKAQFDAASLLIDTEQHESAIDELQDMKKRYPKFEFAVQYDRKLAFAWEKLGKLEQAANAYLALYKSDPDADVRREALYVAATMYDELGDNNKAIDWYLKYVNDYEEPYDLRMETRYRLAVLFLEEKNDERHLYWLRRTIDGDAKGGSQRSDRSRYLAAWAQAAYGDYFTTEFNRVRLTLPLEKPLARKIKALEDAQSRYEKAAEYGIAEFAAKSTYQIADLYYRFFKDLMASERPNGLSELELEEYNFMLEDEAIPFEDQAIALHETNVERSWKNQYNEWVQKSFDALAVIFPARYDKNESVPTVIDMK